jgi:hypothetical protein
MVNYCLAFPYLTGGADIAKVFAQGNGNSKEHNDSTELLVFLAKPFGCSGVRQAAVLLILKW